MERIDIKDLETMSKSKYVCTSEIGLVDKKVFGDEEEHILTVDVFDGLAYCPDYNGKEYWLSFPKKSFVTSFDEMEKTVRAFHELSDDEEITEVHIMAAYSSLFEN